MRDGRVQAPLSHYMLGLIAEEVEAGMDPCRDAVKPVKGSVERTGCRSLQ